ncbi:hypothetical protein EB796_005296 [Bugula neritina]|uniref:Uncharacterized protein n=1 Tax=Bugula neritina TaxID=10212 RepID=A0A7J7KDW2_BUGNE|nr:hypothetical protein EB796_005296 [Bugula neritina]
MSAYRLTSIIVTPIIRELEAERVVEESRLKDTHRDEISSLQKEMDTKTSKEKEDLQNKFKAELEDFKQRAAEEHNSQMTNLKQENDSKVADLRESLEDLSSLKKKELDSALEKIREEIRHELEGQDKAERRKLELDYKNKQQNLRNDLEQEMKEMEKQLQSEFSEKKDNLRNQLNSGHVKKMEEMKREIGEVQEVERQQKEEELSKAKESRRLVSGLETDLQQLLDDKKAQIKVQHESELMRYKRDLESKTQLKKSELSTTDMAERTNLEQGHEEAISKARKEFEKLRESIRLDHKERISRLKLNLDEEEREVEDKSRAMEERKRALDEDQISLEKFSKELAERREKLTKLEKDLKRDETRVGSAEKEKEELVEELSTLRQSLDETRDKLEKSNISRKLLEERLKESETAAKEKAREVERLRKQGKSRIHKKHVRTVTDSDKENNQGDDSRLSMEDLESDEATIGKRSSRHRSLDDSDIIVNRHSRNHSDSYLSMDDTSMSSDYPQVGGKSMRRIINSENAVQIAKRYLRKHAKSLKDAGDAWSETKRRLRTSSGKYHPLAKRYLTESESDSDVTDLADLDTAELQLRINRRMDNLLSPHKDILPTSPQSSPTLPVSSPLSQLQNLSTYDATVRLQQATQTTSPRTFPQTTQTARPSTQPQHIQTDSPSPLCPILCHTCHHTLGVPLTSPTVIPI